MITESMKQRIQIFGEQANALVIDFLGKSIDIILSYRKLNKMEQLRQLGNDIQKMMDRQDYQIYHQLGGDTLHQIIKENDNWILPNNKEIQIYFFLNRQSDQQGGNRQLIEKWQFNSYVSDETQGHSDHYEQDIEQFESDLRQIMVQIYEFLLKKSTLSRLLRKLSKQQISTEMIVHRLQHRCTMPQDIIILQDSIPFEKEEALDSIYKKVEKNGFLFEMSIQYQSVIDGYNLESEIDEDYYYYVQSDLQSQAVLNFEENNEDDDEYDDDLEYQMQYLTTQKSEFQKYRQQISPQYRKQDSDQINRNQKDKKSRKCSDNIVFGRQGRLGSNELDFKLRSVPNTDKLNQKIEESQNLLSDILKRINSEKSQKSPSFQEQLTFLLSASKK